jgi:transposase-like protein
MNTFRNWVLSFTRLLHSIKNENLEWQNANQALQAKLKQTHAINEKALEAELKKRSVQLAHEIALLKTKQASELSMFKTKCTQDIKDYKDYLKSLDQLKHSIQTSYPHLPEAVAFTIHHHAKYLLHKMWEADNYEQKMLHEMQLITFMTTVHEDARTYLEGSSADQLPAKTLRLIDQT